MYNLRKRGFVFALFVPVIGTFAGASVYLLQKGEIVFASGAVAFLGALFTITQWLISQLRESSKISWEAVKTYYSESDTKELLEVRVEIFSGNCARANVFCNFYEKWGRLVQLGYLPIEIFDGSSGVHITNAALAMKDFLIDRRKRNPMYANAYLWLINEVQKQNYRHLSTNSSDVVQLLQACNWKTA